MKKFYIFIFFSICFSFQNKAQNCIPDILVITSQAQIDNFAINYPGCTSIDGTLEIVSPLGEITNLNGLSQLNYIFHLQIHENPALTSLEGLENLTNVNHLYIYWNNTLENLDGLNGLTSTEYFYVRDNDQLISIEGLHNMQSVSEVYISGVALQSLAGLENLPTTFKTLSIGGTELLNDFSPLPHINSLETLTIWGNSGLTDISVFEDIQIISENLYIGNNDSLSNINFFDNLVLCGGIRLSGESLSNLNTFGNITSINGDLNLNLPDFIDNLSVFSHITSIEGFLAIYEMAGITNLEDFSNLETLGGILLYSAYLTSVSGLENITNFSEFLYVSEINNTIDFSGLSNLVSVDGYFRISDMQHPFNISQFQSLESIGSLHISRNSNLQSLQGLENITEIVGDVTISNNNITSLEGLNYLHTINGNLYMYGNSNLSDLTALSNLQVLNGYLKIFYHDALTSLTGLENLDFSTVTKLSLSQNENLSFCNLDNICEYIESH